MFLWLYVGKVTGLRWISNAQFSLARIMQEGLFTFLLMHPLHSAPLSIYKKMIGRARRGSTCVSEHKLHALFCTTYLCTTYYCTTYLCTTHYVTHFKNLTTMLFQRLAWWIYLLINTWYPISSAGHFCHCDTRTTNQPLDPSASLLFLSTLVTGTIPVTRVSNV